MITTKGCPCLQPLPKGTHNLWLSTNRFYFAEQNTVGFMKQDKHNESFQRLSQPTVTDANHHDNQLGIASVKEGTSLPIKSFIYYKIQRFSIQIAFIKIII